MTLTKQCHARQISIPSIPNCARGMVGSCISSRVSVHGRSIDLGDIMANACRICGIPIDNPTDLTCGSDRCFREFKSRRELALLKIRTHRELQREKSGTLPDIQKHIVFCISRVLLDRDIPTYVTNSDLDETISMMDTLLGGLTPRFRKSQITKNVHDVGYEINSSSGRGKITFRVAEDRENVKKRLLHNIDSGVMNENQVHVHI